MPSGLILSEWETPTYTSSRQRVGNVLDVQRRRGPNESRDKDSPSTKSQRPFRRANERLDIRATSPQDQKLSLKAGEPQVGQQHEDMEKNWEYYHIIVFPEWTYRIYIILQQRKKIPRLKIRIMDCINVVMNII